MRTARSLGTILAVVALAAGLTACAPERGTTVPIPIPTASPSSTAAPTGKPDPDPTLLPGGTALANRDYFDFVNNRLLAVNGNPAGKAIIDNLVAAGFDKSAMQITPDRTAVLRGPADAIEFSVRTSNDCLIGQFAGGAYRSIIGPVLSDGGCLVGRTRPIDW